MSTEISPQAHVDATAQLGTNVRIGPFCVVGPQTKIGDDTVLESHVSIMGTVSIGARNLLMPFCVIGGHPQDVSYSNTETSVEIGDDNVFREGVTVNRGAEKEDGVTRIDNRSMFMANSHVAHNCHIFSNVILVNGVLLGGHVHVHDGAIVSGNSVVHHFSTLGRLSFVSGGCRVPHDIPPFMMAAGSDDPTIVNINRVGMQRAGLSDATIEVMKQAFRLLYRKNKKLQFVRDLLQEQLLGMIPQELEQFFLFIENQQRGRMGRAREAVREDVKKAA